MSEDVKREVDQLRVRQVMRDRPIVVDSEMTVREAAIAMDRADLGCVLVTSKGREVVGIVTERDLVRRVLTTPTKDSETQVKDVMSTQLVVVSPETSVEEAARIMASNKIRRLPVAEKQQLVGIITVVDIARAWASTAEQHDPVLDALTRIPGPHSRVLASAWRASMSARNRDLRVRQKYYGNSDPGHT